MKNTKNCVGHQKLWENMSPREPEGDGGEREEIIAALTWRRVVLSLSLSTAQRMGAFCRFWNLRRLVKPLILEERPYGSGRYSKFLC